MLAGHLHPALAPAGHLVGRSLAQQPAVDPGHLDRAHVRRVLRVAGDVEGEPVLVLVEHESHGAHRLDDLQPQRADADRVEVGAQPARQPDVVLAAVVAQAHEAVEHVVVLVEPHVRGEADVAVHVGAAHVVPVVPLRITA